MPLPVALNYTVKHKEITSIIELRARQVRVLLENSFLSALVLKRGCVSLAFCVPVSVHARTLRPHVNADFSWVSGYRCSKSGHHCPNSSVSE